MHPIKANVAKEKTPKIKINFRHKDEHINISYAFTVQNNRQKQKLVQELADY